MKRRSSHKNQKRLFKSLYVKFVAVFSVTIIVATVCMGVALSSYTRNFLSNSKFTDMEKAIDNISYLMVQYVQSDEYGSSQVLTTDPSSQYYILRSRMATCHDILNADVYITDYQGNVMMSFPLLPNENDYISTDTVYFPVGYEKKFLETPDGFSFLNTSQYSNCFRTEEAVVDYDDFHGFYTEKDGSHLTVSKRIVSHKGANAEVFGAVTMSYPMPELAETQRSLVRAIAISITAALVVETVIMLFVTRFITRPLGNLKEGAEAIAGGDFDIHIEKTTTDEIGDLVEAFNMAAKSLNNLDTVRNDFIANVSHELRTPMTSIKGFVEAILDEVIPPEKHREYLTKVQREIARMNGLVNELLDWARLSAGQGNLQMNTFDVNRVASIVIANLEPVIRPKNIEVITKFARTQEMVYGDSGSIERVFINLIQNAIKFTPEGGRITVLTRYLPAEKRVKIQVQDSGIGMSEEEQALVFERFYKADKSRSNDKRGTGLGLSIVQKILQNHNQKISVTSKKNEGSCFTFYLDREAPHEEN